MPESLRQSGPTDGAGSAARGSSTAWPRQSEEALGLSPSMGRAGGIVCSAPADRAGPPDTSERANAEAALKPRPEWVRGKAEALQLNNHPSSANPPHEPEHPRKAKPLDQLVPSSRYLGVSGTGRRDLPSRRAAQYRGAGPQLPGRRGEHALLSPGDPEKLLHSLARNPGPSCTSAKCR